MLQQKEDEIREFNKYQFKANDIPRTTKEPLYERIMQFNEERRLEVKRNSLAITM